MDYFKKLLIVAGMLISPYLTAGDDGVDYVILAKALGAIHNALKNDQGARAPKEDDEWRQWCEAIERVRAHKDAVARRNSAASLNKNIVGARLFTDGVDNGKPD